MRTLSGNPEAISPAAEQGLTSASGRQSRQAIRRQPPDAAAARAAVEEVPRKVRRADHQDPARCRAACRCSSICSSHRSRASYTLGGIVVALVVAALAGASVFKRQAMGADAAVRRGHLVLSPIGLATGHASFEGLAVMVAVILATGVAFLSEYKSDREFEVLNAQKESLRRQGAARRRISHDSAGRSRGRRRRCWRSATRFLPTAGLSRRPICTSTSR